MRPNYQQQFQQNVSNSRNHQEGIGYIKSRQRVNSSRDSGGGAVGIIVALVAALFVL